MTSEVSVVIYGIEHTLRGERAVRFNAIVAAAYAARPELFHAGRLERKNVEEAAFREVTHEGN
jgi:hypothetical protein